MSHLDNKIINIISNNNAHSISVSDLLKEKLREKNFIVNDYYSQNAILNICVGGDGAFLRAIHKYEFPNIPFIGINTGHLGFFQEIIPENIDEFIEKFIKDDYQVEETSLVKAKVKTSTDEFSLYGLNEIAIKGVESKIIHLKIYINDMHLENFSGDGIIISTPSGSTAYNLSAGGSLVHPSIKALQLTPIAPINSNAYRSLSNSVIMPYTIAIKIEPEYVTEESILLILDGMEYSYNDIQEIQFSIPMNTIKRLIMDRNIYWNNLKNKFL